MSERNWAGNVVFAAERVVQPTTIGRLQEVVAEAAASGRRMHAVGAGHSFSAVADTTGDLVSTAALDRIVEIDREHMTVTVESGVRYAELSAALHAEGLGLHNLPSLPHVTVAGAVATGTHGSGQRNGSLATVVRGLLLVLADGSVEHIDDADPRLHGAVVSLGALGIAASVTLAVEPTFDVEQRVFTGLPMDRGIEQFDEVMGAAHSVSIFTDWVGGRFDQVWTKHRVDDERRFDVDAMFGAVAADVTMHPVPSVSAEHCTTQLGVPGPWHERLPHFRAGFTPSVGDELQTEYFVDRDDARDAMVAIRGIADRFTHLLLVSEIRSIARDGLWLSPAWDRDSVAFHFTWRPDQAAVVAVLPTLEAALAPFRPRPHWGKLSAMPATEIRATYERFDDFVQLCTRLDPDGTFRNPYLDRLLTA